MCRIWISSVDTSEPSLSGSCPASRFFPFSGLVKCGHCGGSLVAQVAKGRYIYYHCSGFRGKCPERYLRQEVLEGHFLGLLRKFRCDTQEFEKIRRDFEQVRLGAGANIGELALLPRRDPSPGTPGALVRDGLALLDIGRTAHLRLTKLPDEMKQQVLSLIFLRCSWADGELIGWFNSPFDILAEHGAANSADSSELSLIQRVSDTLSQPTPETRLLVARYKAMCRAGEELVIDMPRSGNDEGPFLPITARLAA